MTSTKICGTKSHGYTPVVGPLGPASMLVLMALLLFHHAAFFRDTGTLGQRHHMSIKPLAINELIQSISTQLTINYSFNSYQTTTIMPIPSINTTDPTPAEAAAQANQHNAVSLLLNARLKSNANKRRRRRKNVRRRKRRRNASVRRRKMRKQRGRRRRRKRNV